VCTTIVVGRNRSATGQVMVAHSEELGRNSAHRVTVVHGRDVPPGERFPLHSSGEIDQPTRIARHLVTKIFDKRHYPGEHTVGINEHGVAVANNMAMMRGIPEARMYDVIPGGIIWTEFLQLVLERARSAREGAALVGEMCGRHGLSCDSGTMVAVADPDEAWWVELARDGVWAAERVGDDNVSVRANCYRIGSLEPRPADSVTKAPIATTCWSPACRPSSVSAYRTSWRSSVTCTRERPSIGPDPTAHRFERRSARWRA
jgi:dipeptidase